MPRILLLFVWILGPDMAYRALLTQQCREIAEFGSTSQAGPDLNLQENYGKLLNPFGPLFLLNRDNYSCPLYGRTSERMET